MSREGREGRWVQLGVLALLTYMIAAYGGVYDWAWGSATLVAVGAGLLMLGRAVAVGGKIRWDPLYVIALAYFGIGAWQWGSGQTAYRGSTLTELLQLGGLGAIFFLATEAVRRPGGVRRFALWAWAMGGVLGFEAITQELSSNKWIYWLHDATYATPIGPYVYHNHFAGCAEMLLPLGFAYGFRAARGEPQALAWVRRGLCPALLIAALVLSASRAGAVILAGELAVMLWLLRPRGPAQQWRAGWMLLGMAAITVVLVGWGPLARRFSKMGANDPSVQDRWRVSQSCLRIFRSSPWIGTGLGTFPSVYPAYASFDNGQSFEEAHNEYAQMLAESGLLGGLLVAAFLALFAQGAAPLVRRPLQFEERLRAAAVVGAAAILVHSVVDFQFHAPANAALFFALVAVSRAPVTQGHLSRRTSAITPGRDEASLPPPTRKLIRISKHAADLG